MLGNSASGLLFWLDVMGSCECLRYSDCSKACILM